MGAVLAADRRRELRPVALQDLEARELLPGVSEEERMASVHFVEHDGTVRSAGAALARLVSYLPAARPLGGLGERRHALSERVYRLVADNRDRIGPLIPEGLKRRATALIERRSHR